MGRPDRALETEVIRRAGGRCECCRFPEAAAELPFHVDHVVAEKHGGATISSNLAWACFPCRLRKSPNVAGLDPLTGELTRLFHPRTDAWTEHFAWQGVWLLGLTAIGRTTVAVLVDINLPENAAVREALRAEGLFEP
ncbi:MAG: HNH endonuclease [Planctomycetes bacterium]|nr:HNH endonuclease [Planctomycetota bacterium]